VDEIEEFSVLPGIKTVSAKIWRYLSWEKYQWLLTERRLYFPKADLFEDLFEGAATEGDRALQQAFFEEYDITEKERARVRNVYSWNKRFTFVSAFGIARRPSQVR
jgi:hypothetical protein